MKRLDFIWMIGGIECLWVVVQIIFFVRDCWIFEIFFEMFEKMMCQRDGMCGDDEMYEIVNFWLKSEGKLRLKNCELLCVRKSECVCICFQKTFFFFEFVMKLAEFVIGWFCENMWWMCDMNWCDGILCDEFVWR